MKKYLWLLLILALFGCKQKERIETYYDEGGIHQEYVLVEGEIEGELKEYYEDGKLYQRFQYQNGELNGNWEQYYPNGLISKVGYYKNNLLNGAYLEYTEFENLIQKSNFVDGHQDGITVEYYKSGIVKDSILYSQGLKNGFAYFFDEKGVNTLYSLMQNDSTDYFVKYKSTGEVQEVYRKIIVKIDERDSSSLKLKIVIHGELENAKGEFSFFDEDNIEKEGSVTQYFEIDQHGLAKVDIPLTAKHSNLIIKVKEDKEVHQMFVFIDDKMENILETRYISSKMK